MPTRSWLISQQTPWTYLHEPPGVRKEPPSSEMLRTPEENGVPARRPWVEASAPPPQNITGTVFQLLQCPHWLCCLIHILNFHLLGLQFFGFFCGFFFVCFFCLSVLMEFKHLVLKIAGFLRVGKRHLIKTRRRKACSLFLRKADAFLHHKPPRQILPSARGLVRSRDFRGCFENNL